MSKKVLVIDDEPTMVKLIKLNLEANQQYQVITASDGIEGLERLKIEKPALVLLDVQMPKMDGYSFLLEFKKITNLKDTPVIILTAKEKLQDLFKIEGIKDYFVKPFKIEDLLAKIKSYIG